MVTQTDDQPDQIVHATPLIDPATPYGAQLTLVTALERRRYTLTRELLEDLALQISRELQRAPLPEHRG